MFRAGPSQEGRSAAADRRSRVTLVTVAVSLLTFGTGVVRAAGEPAAGDELQQAKARVERLSEDLTGSRARFDRLNERAASARLAESRIEDGIVRGEVRLERIGERLRGAREMVRLAGRRLGLARGRLAARLVAIYESGTSDAVAILLATEDFGDLAATGTYLEAIAESERDLARRVAELRRARLDALEETRRSRRLMAEQVSGLRKARSTIVEARLDTEQAISSLTSVQRQRKAKIDELRADVERIESEMAQTSGGENFAGGPYSIPTYIVMCESGGNYSALNPSSGAGGAYQILPSTWEAYGGKGLPHLAPKSEQDRIARLIWENDGPGAWVCA